MKRDEKYSEELVISRPHSKLPGTNIHLPPLLPQFVAGRGGFKCGPPCVLNGPALAGPLHKIPRSGSQAGGSMGKSVRIAKNFLVFPSGASAIASQNVTPRLGDERCVL